MEPHEIKGLHCLPHPPTQKPYPPLTNLNMQPIESTNRALTHATLPENPDDNSDRFFSNSLIHPPFHIFSPNTSSLSIDSTLNKQGDHQLDIVVEKRLRRMISNRESARRSRVRRKKQIEELQSRVSQLTTTNHQLSEKVIHLLESNRQILQENSQLKERVSSLQVVLSDLLTPSGNEENTSTNSTIRNPDNGKSLYVPIRIQELVITDSALYIQCTWGCYVIGADFRNLSSQTKSITC